MTTAFSWDITLASHPLRHGYQNGPPKRSCSGALVDCFDRRVLLTVAHSVRPDEEWAVELGYEGAKGTCLWELEDVRYLIVRNPITNEPIDFAFAQVDRDMQARWQRFKEDGSLEQERDRIVLRSDLSAAPVVGATYGFAGHTEFTHEPRPPGFHHAILGAQTRVEPGLGYLNSVDGLDRYSLNHPHPGDKFYEGCSGAPILSTDGILVGLVVSGLEGDGTIFGLPLREYRDELRVLLSAPANPGA